MTPEQARQNLIASLAEVRSRMRAGADDWRYSLMRTFREYCVAIGIDRQLVHPIQRMLFEAFDAASLERRRKQGKVGTPMPGGRQATLLVAAAAVTVLKKRGVRIADALKIVAEFTGIDRKEIRSFRDNLNRGKYGGDVEIAYRNCIEKINAWPPELMFEGLVGLDSFVP